MEDVFVDEPGLQPLAKDTFLHRDVSKEPFMADFVEA
jgi:hypothetical protein